MVPSWVSFVSSGGTAELIEEDTEKDGGSVDSIVYREMRWSGPAVFPALGSARSSLTTSSRFESIGYFSTRTLNNSTEPARARTFDDFALLSMGVRSRRKVSVSRECGYASKNRLIAKESLAQGIIILKVGAHHSVNILAIAEVPFPLLAVSIS